MTKAAYLRDAEREIAKALVNLWCWSTIIETKQRPEDAVYYVYNGELSLGGNSGMNGKRFKVTIEVEEEARR